MILSGSLFRQVHVETTQKIPADQKGNEQRHNSPTTTRPGKRLRLHFANWKDPPSTAIYPRVLTINSHVQ